MPKLTKPLAALFVSLIAWTLPATAESEQSDTTSAVSEAYANAKGEVSDAYIAGRLVTAYTISEHLNPFKIDVEVNDGVIRLAGKVANAVQRDLAVEIAKGVPQARQVQSALQIDPRNVDSRASHDDSFGQSFSDATTTARVKSRLVLNQSTSGLSIDVDTAKDIVTLTGQVASHTEAALAEQIAQNTDGVEKVRNQLDVKKSS